MTDHPYTEVSVTDADWARPLYARQIAMLGELAEAGLRIALEVERKLTVDEQAAQPQEAIAVFARVSRAVRLSLMLQARLIKALEERDRHRGYLDAFAATEKKARVSRIVERIAQRQDLDEDDIDRLVDETTERLDHDDIYGEVLSRPTSDLVAAICKDLGLAIDWPALSEEAWLQEEMTLPPSGGVVLKKTPLNLTPLRPPDERVKRGKTAGGAARPHPS